MELQTDVVKERVIPRVKAPSFFKVIMLNDDYTPMEFVVRLLESIFKKSPTEAHRLMLEIHQSGRAVCGRYTFEIAETKAAQVLQEAKKENYPLCCLIEQE